MVKPYPGLLWDLTTTGSPVGAAGVIGIVVAVEGGGVHTLMSIGRVVRHARSTHHRDYGRRYLGVKP